MFNPKHYFSHPQFGVFLNPFYNLVAPNYSKFQMKVTLPYLIVFDPNNLIFLIFDTPPNKRLPPE